jgi:CHAT domain-containing protein
MMAEFYENLWMRKLGNRESLRQAQLTMIHHYDSQSGQLRGSGKRVTTSAAELAKAREKQNRSDGSLPPFFWAGFILSGDWR